MLVVEHLCPNHWHQRSWSWTVLWWPTRPSRTNNNDKKRCPFHNRKLECKSRKSRDTQNNSQVWPWSTKWSRAKVNRVLSRENTGQSTHTFPTIQETVLHMDLHKWSIPKSDWLYYLQLKMKKIFTVSKNKTWYWLWLSLFINSLLQTRLKLKKVGKTTRPFKYDLNDSLMTI